MPLLPPLLRTLLKGSWGSRVRGAQEKLINLNLLRDSADGKYGANTETAVLAFEKMLSDQVPDIQRDGRLSTEEYALLMSDLSVYGIEAPIYFDDDHPEKLKETYLYAKHACLINAVTGDVLFEKAADEQAEPASTTKIVTLITALSLCNPEETIVIPDEATDVPEDSTLVPVEPGEMMTMQDLLYGMMIRSGNDAANAVAVLCSGSTEAFAERYLYDGDDLGAVTGENGTTFKVWAPTAGRVVLNLFEAGDGCDAYETLDMVRGEKGVWSADAPCGAGTYYTYTVTTAAGEQEAVDPYARAVGVNGDRGMVIDLASTDPEGFAADTFVDSISAYNEAVIWEVHVRDFSNKLASSAYPGKYLAFTEHGLTNAAGEPAGIDYLTDLGITHVHLQPVYDYATVNEASEEPQFNWGYDPKNYNAPEGSYSTDPYHGEVRVKEFKQMVQALHESGLGVVMDVVYNHTYDGNSCLNRIVPYYYYRFDYMGDWSNGSGCGNETASDRAMFRKYMVDSVSYWAKEYHVDGFRFDLMALHDVQTMQEIEQAVHAINPKALLYGEGWTGGTTTLMEGKRASQANIKKVQASEGAAGGVAVFNDSIRDGLKGSVFNASEKGYISGNVSRERAYQVVFGLTGGVKNPMVSWSVPGNGVINYMACHDNHTLFDRLLSSNAEYSLEDRLKMNRFGISIVMIGRGTPFFLAGEEILRTKGGDSNSYKSSDEVNNIRWDDLAPGSDAMAMRDFYRSLIALRKANPFLTKGEIACEVLKDNAIEATWTEDGKVTAYAVINPGMDREVALPEGEWQALILNEKIDPDGTETISGTVTAGGRTVLLVRAK